MRCFIKQLPILLLLFNLISSVTNGQGFKLSMDYNYGSYEFSTSKNSAYLSEAENKNFNAGALGVKLLYDLGDIKMSLRVSSLSQSLAWDSINVRPLTDNRVWSSVNMEYSRIQFFFGLGHQAKIGRFYLEPEAAIMFSKATSFEVDENIRSGGFTQYPPAEYSIHFNEYGGRLSIEIGYLLNNKMTISLRPYYFYGELEGNFVRITNTFKTNITDNITKGIGLGFEVGYILN